MELCWGRDHASLLLGVGRCLVGVEVRQAVAPLHACQAVP